MLTTLRSKVSAPGRFVLQRRYQSEGRNPYPLFGSSQGVRPGGVSKCARVIFDRIVCASGSASLVPPENGALALPG